MRRRGKRVPRLVITDRHQREAEMPPLPTTEIKDWYFAARDGSTFRFVLARLAPGLRVFGFNMTDADHLAAKDVTVRSRQITQLDRHLVTSADQVYVLKGSAHPAYRQWCLANGWLLNDADPACGSIPLLPAELAEPPTTAVRPPPLPGSPT